MSTPRPSIYANCCVSSSATVLGKGVQKRRCYSFLLHWHLLLCFFLFHQQTFRALISTTMWHQQALLDVFRQWHCYKATLACNGTERFVYYRLLYCGTLPKSKEIERNVQPKTFAFISQCDDEQFLPFIVLTREPHYLWDSISSCHLVYLGSLLPCACSRSVYSKWSKDKPKRCSIGSNSHKFYCLWQ